MSQKRYASARLDHLRRPHDHDDQWVQLPARGGFLLAFFSSCSPRVHRVEAGAWNRQTDGQTGGSQQCIKYTHAVNISVARTVCGAGSRQRHGVCLFEVSVSVCLSVCQFVGVSRRPPASQYYKTVTVHACVLVFIGSVGRCRSSARQSVCPSVGP